MLSAGERIPQADVWTAPHERTTVAQIAGDGPAFLLFYLFDWSST
jgi:hypothetical protein